MNLRYLFKPAIHKVEIDEYWLDRYQPKIMAWCKENARCGYKWRGYSRIVPEYDDFTNRWHMRCWVQVFFKSQAEAVHFALVWATGEPNV